REQAIEILSHTDQFADAYVGFAGSPSPEACAFRAVLDQPDADRLFKQLLAKAHLPGRLYALCGLYFTDHEAFAKEIQPYRSSRDSVAIFQGCIMSRAKVASLVESKDPRAVRLKDPSETMQEWLRRTREAGGSQNYILDILGGGWSDRFKEMKNCD